MGYSTFYSKMTFQYGLHVLWTSLKNGITSSNLIHLTSNVVFTQHFS
jgi:hypothetical protein